MHDWTQEDIGKGSSDRRRRCEDGGEHDVPDGRPHGPAAHSSPVMCIRPGEDIGREVHRGHDQFLRIVEGDTRASSSARTKTRSSRRSRSSRVGR